MRGLGRRSSATAPARIMYRFLSCPTAIPNDKAAYSIASQDDSRMVHPGHQFGADESPSYSNGGHECTPILLVCDTMALLNVQIEKRDGSFESQFCRRFWIRDSR